MTIEEAIKHAEEVASANERLCETVNPAMQLSDYGKCAKEHRQLAEWLKELKRYREAFQKIIDEIKKEKESAMPGEFYDGVFYALGFTLGVIDKALGEVGEQDG